MLTSFAGKRLFAAPLEPSQLIEFLDLKLLAGAKPGKRRRILLDLEAPFHRANNSFCGVDFVGEFNFKPVTESV
jgi:hypothetical protein